jgi:hypothetical protein
MADERAADFELGRADRFQHRWDLVFGDETARSAAASSLEGLPNRDIIALDQGAIGLMDEHLEQLEPLRAAHQGSPLSRLGDLYRARGRFNELRGLMVGDSTPSGRTQIAGLTLQLFHEGSASTEDLRAAYRTIRVGNPGPDANVHLFRGLVAGALTDASGFETSRAATLVALGAAFAKLPEASNVDTVGIRESLTLMLDVTPSPQQETRWWRISC